MNVVDKHNDYNIFIDDKFINILRTTTDTVYTLAQDLENKKHSLILTKRTEARNGVAIFKGLILNRGDSLCAAFHEKRRKIEFVGDSFVAGLGSEGKSPDCRFSRETENSSIAFGPVLAKRFNTDYSIVAVSGIGVVRNAGESTGTSEHPLPYYYERDCFNDTLKWNFQKWQPDLVVVRLGNNDFWGKPYPPKTVYQTAYINFLQTIRKLYPGAVFRPACN